jgi:arylsulfatase A
MKLKILISLFALSVAARFAGAAPNVVVFLVDDQAWGDLGCHGNEIAQTPNIDAFAGESVEFERFYVSPVCSLTRASTMTGRWNFRTGVTSVQGATCTMDLDEVTVAEVLRNAGYATAMYGKWHLGETGENAPHERGFEDAVYPRSHQFGKYHNPKAMHNGEAVNFEGYSIDLWVDHGIDFIQKAQEEEQPFFLYLPTNLVHTPLDAKPEYAQRYLDQGLPKSVSKIYGMQDSIDEQFGRLLKALEESGCAENTLVIYFSDNGPQGQTCEGRFHAGLRGIKGSVYENGIRVPSFIRWPGGGVPAGGKEDRIAAHIDLMPTILDACGVSTPKGVAMDGRSLMPLLAGKKKRTSWPDRTLFFQWDGREYPEAGKCIAVVGQKYKLVQAGGNVRDVINKTYLQVAEWNGRKAESIAEPGAFELFAIERDPGESQDIAGKFPEVVQDMSAAYDRWFKEVTDH